MLARHDKLAFESSSEASGAYALSVYADTEFHLTAQKDHESRANRGVDVSDIIMMRKHILSMERLDSLVSKIAADVNQDHSIDVLDIVAMRKMIWDCGMITPRGLTPACIQLAPVGCPHLGTPGPGIAGGGSSL